MSKESLYCASYSVSFRLGLVENRYEVSVVLLRKCIVSCKFGVLKILVLRSLCIVIAPPTLQSSHPQQCTCRALFLHSVKSAVHRTQLFPVCRGVLPVDPVSPGGLGRARP